MSSLMLAERRSNIEEKGKINAPRSRTRFYISHINILIKLVSKEKTEEQREDK